MSILDENIDCHLTTFGDVAGPYGIVWGGNILVSSTNNIIEDDLFEVFNNTPLIVPFELAKQVIDVFMNGLGQLVLPFVDTKIPLNERFTFRLTQGTAIIGDMSFLRGIELIYCGEVVFAYFYTNAIKEIVQIAQHYKEIKKEEQ